MFKPKFYSTSENIVKRRKAEKLRLKFPKIVKDAVRRNLLSDITNCENEKSIFDDDENAKDGCDRTLVIDETEVGDQEDTNKCVNSTDLIPENKELCRFDLGDNLYIVANKFMGKLYVHIREYAQGVNGIYPTKKGIALDLEKWKKIGEIYYKDVTESIDKNEEFKQHLGENVYLSIQKGYACVNIRKWFLPENQENIVPTKKGIALTFKKWNNLKGAIDLVSDVLKDQLAEVTFCEDSNDHQNQMGFFTCRRCNPNDFMNY